MATRPPGALIDSPDTIAQALAAANLTFVPQEESNLQVDNPHDTSLLVWASPPVPDMGQPGTAQNYTPVGEITMAVEVPGATITLGSWPTGQRVASVIFQQNSGVLSVDLACCIDNQSTDGIIGVMVTKDIGPVSNLAQNSDVSCVIFAYQGQYVKKDSVNFSIDIAPLIKQSTSIAIYAFGSGSSLAASKVAASAIIRYVSLDD